MSPTTMLFVPADRADRFEKAASSGADIVVIDLEDAVAIDRKEIARANISGCSLAPERVYIRVNPPNTSAYKADIASIQKTPFRNIMLAKAEYVPDLEALATFLGSDTQIVPLIETALALDNVRALASHRSVPFLAFGSLDFALDLGCEHTLEALMFARQLLVFHSRMAQKLPPIDGITVAIDDPNQIRLDASRARDLGFIGKLLIHPKQIEPVLEAFRPSADDIAWAQAIQDAISDTGSGVLCVNGQMIDRPVLLRAERILARALAR